MNSPRRGYLATVLVGLVVLALASGGKAEAHARLVWSDPAADSVLATPPDHVTIGFSDAVARGTDISVVDSAGNDMAVGPVSRTGDQASVGLLPLPPGAYAVTWVSVSAEDGHEARDSFQFTVLPPEDGS